MILHWTPSQPNGWFPKVSPDGRYVAYGNNHMWCEGLATGEEHDLGEGWPMGWFDAQTLVITRELIGNGPREMSTVKVGEWVRRVSPVDPQMVQGSWFAANKGHWGAVGRSRVVYDGQVVEWGAFCGLAQDGEWQAAWEFDRGVLRIWKAGAHVRDIRPASEPYEFSIHEGTVIFGHGHLFMSPPNGVITDVTGAPSWGEGCPVLIDVGGALWLWAFTFTEDTALGPQVIGHPIGSHEVVMVPMIGIDLSVAVTDTAFVVAGTTNKGVLTVVTVPLDTPRQVFPPRPPDPPYVPPVEAIPEPPEFAPLDRDVYFGFYKDRDGICPGNCHIVEGRGLIRKRDDALIASNPLGHEVEGTLWRTVWGEEWIGVQAYLDAPGPNTMAECVSAMRAKLRAVLEPLRDQPVCLIPQWFDRPKQVAGDNWTSIAGLHAMQEAVYEAIRDYPNIVAVVGFSGQDRVGGLGSYPGLVHWAQAIAATVREPEIPTPEPNPEPTPEPNPTPEPEPPVVVPPIVVPPVPTPPTVKLGWWQRFLRWLVGKG